MSEQTTAGIAEQAQFDRDVTECLRNGPAVHLVNSKPAEPEPRFKHWQVGMIEADPNHTAESHPHNDVVRTKLRAKVKDLNADPQERAEAAEALRVMYRE